MGVGWGRKAGRGSRDLLLGPGESVFYMLYIYAKVEQGDLTPLQVRALAKVVREEFK